MKTITPRALVRLGSARAATRADAAGDQMELIPGRFYTVSGVRADLVSLGGARSVTRAVEGGERLELIPARYWQAAGASLA